VASKPNMALWGSINAAAEAIGDLGTAYSQATAITSKSNYETQAMMTNARMADLMAEMALKRGASQARKYGIKAKGIQSSQRAGIAAQGIQVDKGSAARVEASTAHEAALDLMEIRNNAWRESFGYKWQAEDMRTKARLKQISSDFQSKSTLIQGGLQAVNSVVGTVLGGGV